MLNQYPFWKHIIIIVVLVIGCFFALPNLYGEDPAVQISAARGTVVDETLVTRISEQLEAAGLESKSPPGFEQDLLLVRFEDEDTQLRAQDVLKKQLGRQFIVALNLAPATPKWLAKLGVLPMYLGLDLRGGVHFLMEVDMAAAVSQAEERYLGDIRSLLRTERIRHKGATRAERGILLRFRDESLRDVAVGKIQTRFSELEFEQETTSDAWNVWVRMTEKAADDTRRFALQQNITTLRNRVNELGVAEPLIQQQGDSRIVVQLPGVQDTARAKEILGATATLEFRMLHETASAVDAVGGDVPIDGKLYRERNGRPVVLRKAVMLTGDSITNAASGIEQQTGSPAVFINLDGQGARVFSERTRDEIGRRMAVVFIEHKTETVVRNGESVRDTEVIQEVISIATIRDQLGGRFQITGLDSTEEARDLALLLRAGALAAPIEIVEERTVGPTLGKENIDKGKLSVTVAFLLVLVFMVIWYRLFGLVANIALTFNLILIIAILSMLQATLTLPGIAGIVLTVGMAVDANVLIFERIREEIRNGNSPQASIHAGYEKALSTIADANITTLIAAVVLFGFGTGPIKGFAITLSIGIVCSMFTAIMGTRSVINLIYGGKRVSALSL